MPGNFIVITIDVGQGDSILVVFPDDSLILVDCGCKKNLDIVKDPIEKVLNEHLPAARNRLKALVLTHPDDDHYNLIEELIIKKDVFIENLLYGGNADDYKGIGKWIKSHKNNTAKPRQIGEVWRLPQNCSSDDRIPELSYTGLTADENIDVRLLAANVGATNNDNSIVLMISHLSRGVNVFLMGDATNVTESFILRNVSSKLLTSGITMIKAGHHGSDTSSSAEWIDKISPQVVFISSDTRSFSGVSLPRAETIKRFLDKKSLYSLSGKFPNHFVVQYNKDTQRHENLDTEFAIFTTLYLLKYKAGGINFTSYGTSWYYGIDHLGQVHINPRCTWPNIKKPV